MSSGARIVIMFMALALGGWCAMEVFSSVPELLAMCVISGSVVLVLVTIEKLVLRVHKKVVDHVAAVSNRLASEAAAKKLKRERDLVLDAVSQDGLALKNVAPEFKQDYDVVLVAVKQNGCALQYAAEELKRDRDLALAAVSQNGSARKFVSDELSRDKDIFLASVSQITKTELRKR